MATVYLAEDLKHHRKVAVKVLRPELAAILGAERFLKGIEVTANLQHPHILPLHDSGRRLVWVDRDGMMQEIDPDWTTDFESVALSPDGTQLAVSTQNDVWIKDLPAGRRAGLHSAEISIFGRNGDPTDKR
jgi:serine/threonine protein kinase